MIVLEIPAIEIGPPEDMSAVDRALDEMNTYGWIAFTSRNGVDFFLARARERRIAVSGPRIAAVGPATAARLQEQSITVDICAVEATAAALAAELVRVGVAGLRVLTPGGDRSRPELADALRDAGARVDAVVVYRTLPAETGRERLAAMLTGGRVDAVALASPSALDAIIAALDGDLRPLRRVRLVCIGPTTAAAVRSAGLQPAAVAEPHTAAGLAAAIAGLFTE